MSDYDPAADTDPSASASNRVGRNAAGVLAKTAHLHDALAVGHEVGLARSRVVYITLLGDTVRPRGDVRYRSS